MQRTTCLDASPDNTTKKIQVYTDLNTATASDKETGGAKHPHLSLHPGAPLGPTECFFTNVFFSDLPFHYKINYMF